MPDRIPRLMGHVACGRPCPVGGAGRTVRGAGGAVGGTAKPFSANQKHRAVRMPQRFDNKLRGAVAPDWMVPGIAAKEKGKVQVNLAANPTTP